MASFSIDRRQLMAELEVADPILKREADKVMMAERFLPAVEQLKTDFASHAVTREIMGGVGASNESGTLEGDFRDEEGDSPPNLTSFIGFNQSPGEVIGPILQRLDPRHEDGPKMVYKGRDKSSERSEVGSRLSFRYLYEIRAPDEGAIYDATPFPDAWLEDGDVSWVKRLEQGIPGIGHFLNVFGRPSSRSGGGIQVAGTVRSGGRFRPTPYLTRMFNNFLRRADGRSDNGRTV